MVLMVLKGRDGTEGVNDDVTGKGDQTNSNGRGVR